MMLAYFEQFVGDTENDIRPAWMDALCPSPVFIEEQGDGEWVLLFDSVPDRDKAMAIFPANLQVVDRDGITVWVQVVAR